MEEHGGDSSRNISKDWKWQRVKLLAIRKSQRLNEKEKSNENNKQCLRWTREMKEVGKRNSSSVAKGQMKWNEEK